MGAVGVDECELLPRNETRPDNTLGQQKKIIEKKQRQGMWRRCPGTTCEERRGHGGVWFLQ